MTLSIQDMANISSVFQESYNAAMARHSPEQKGVISRYMIALTSLYLSTVIVTPAGSIGVRDEVFGTKEIRDFTFSLQAIFFTRWGGDAAAYESLIESVARGVSVPAILSGDTTQVSLIPEEITARLIDEVGAKNLLKANRWLLTLLLVQMFLNPQLEGTQD